MERNWLFSNLLLCNMMEVKWCIAIVFILIRAFVMEVSRI